MRAISWCSITEMSRVGKGKKETAFCVSSSCSVLLSASCKHTRICTLSALVGALLVSLPRVGANAGRFNAVAACKEGEGVHFVCVCVCVRVCLFVVVFLFRGVLCAGVRIGGVWNSLILVLIWLQKLGDGWKKRREGWMDIYIYI